MVIVGFVRGILETKFEILRTIISIKLDDFGDFLALFKLEQYFYFSSNMT